jgi:carbonic anhydrase
MLPLPALARNLSCALPLLAAIALWALPSAARSSSDGAAAPKAATTPLAARAGKEPPAAAPKEPVATAAATAPASAPAKATAAADKPASAARASDAAPTKRPMRPPPPDPMDMLRERLAQRLSSARPLTTPAGEVLQVASRNSLAETTPSAVRKPPPREAPRAAAHAATVSHWGYEGAGGPQKWGELKPEFSTCARGQRQSPIDLRDGIRVDMDPVQFEYRPGGFRVIDNGHTVQVNLGQGNFIEVRGQRYELVQFHFHRPSEETVDGRRYDMSLHLVHRDMAGRLAVVGLLLDAGKPHPVVQQVWNNLPLEKGDEVAARAPLDLAALLPAERGYFTTMGSLTTPPCTEGVLWMVMKQPVQVSPEQIAIFSRLYPMNARPIQSAAGRLIKESSN